jgi:hypothetical protein
VVSVSVKVGKVGSWQTAVDTFCENYYRFVRGIQKNRIQKKKYKPASHRYNRLPLLPSDPGGVQQELIVPTCNANVGMKKAITNMTNRLSVSACNHLF